MDAAAEGDVAAAGPRHVQAVRLVEGLRIAVGGAQRQDGGRAAPERDAVHFAVVDDAPQIELHRGIEAQQLLHRGRDPARVLAQQPHLLRVLQERQHAVADQVGRGLVAGDEQQPQHGQHLALRQRVAGLFRLREGADDVVARLAPAGLDDRQEVGVEGRARGVRASPLPRADERLQDARAGVRPLREARPVLRRHPQHLRNHDHRKRTGHRAHQVEAGRVVDGVEELVHHRPDVRLEGVDDPRRERLVDQGPQARVVRRIEEQHRPVRPRRHGPAAAPVRRHAVGAVREAPEVTQDRLDVRVTGEHPGIQDAAAVHR